MCGNVAAILELDENLKPVYRRFSACLDNFKEPEEKKPFPEYFL